MMQENLGLIVPRQVVHNFRHSLCVSNIINFNALDTAGRFGSGCLFPLYLYPDTEKKDLFSHKKEPEKRKPNINHEFLTGLYGGYKKEPTPEEIFYFIYAVLYSNIYRTKYAEFLRIDFPRVPFTKNYKLFCKMGEYGKKLVDLHLLKSNELDQPIAKFQGKGDNRVEKVKYGQGKVYINSDHYFEVIPLEVWGYQIGGYQVCDKWLKDRKERILSLDDIRHYCKIVTAIGKTIEIQKAIDEIFSEVEKETIDFKF
jgi:predicted helicase